MMLPLAAETVKNDAKCGTGFSHWKLYKAFHVPLAKGALNLREKGIIVLAWVPVAVDTVGEH